MLFKKRVYLFFLILLTCIILAIAPVFVKEIVKNNYGLTYPILIDLSDRDILMRDGYDKMENVDLKVNVLLDGVEITNIVFFPNLHLVSFGIFYSRGIEPELYDINIYLTDGSCIHPFTTGSVGYVYSELEKCYIENVDYFDVKKIDVISKSEN